MYSILNQLKKRTHRCVGLSNLYFVLKIKYDYENMQKKLTFS